MPWMPAASSERRRSSTAATAPASMSRRPRTSAACRSQKRRADIRRPDGRNAVPTIGPVADVSSAAPAASAAASSTGTPDAAAMAAAVILVAMPPRPSPLPVRATVTASRSVGASTSRSRPGARRARVAVVQAVDVGEQHQRVRADDVRDERGEPVVVAHPDLVGGHRVVLVHDRQHLEPEQALQRALRVAVVRAADHVVGGEQHLADGLAVAGERPRVRLGEQELADRGRGLLGGEVARAADQPQRREPCRDRPRRDEHHLAARGAALGEGVDERVEPGRVEAAGQRRERRRPHLHDDPPGGREGGPGHDRRERYVTVPARP